MKSKKGIKTKIIIAILAIVIILLGAIMVISSNINSVGSEALITNDAQKERSKDVFRIETEYCELAYPTVWEDTIKIEKYNGDSYTVAFSVEDTKLFDLNFNGGDGNILGTLNLEDEGIVIRTVSYELDSSVDNYETYAMMQDDMNIIVKYLVDDYGFVLGDNVDSSEKEETYEIETSFVSLYYPQKWENVVDIEEEDGVVYFSSNDVNLFAVAFTGDDGSIIGTYDGDEVRIITYDIEENEFSDSEYLELRAMQEDVDVVIKALTEKEDFVLK